MDNYTIEMKVMKYITHKKFKLQKNPTVQIENIEYCYVLTFHKRSTASFFFKMNSMLNISIGLHYFFIFPWLRRHDGRGHF